MPPRHVLYFHGFRSSPLSTKALRVKQALADRDPGLEFCCPQLPPSPREAIGLALAQCAHWAPEETALIGSSLGGFYASVLAEQRGGRAVLLNPAVSPDRDLATMIGEQTVWQRPEERFFFQPEFIAELCALKPATLTRPERYACVIAKGDEVLDWREMHDRHAGARMLLLEGSDHALTEFDEALAFLLRFLDLSL
jgi:predicted esterase YcpF (UPF0227 family)